jgi:hypothetical protein
MIAESDRDENHRWLKRLGRIAESRASQRSLAANLRHVAAKRRQSAAFCSVATRGLMPKTVSMETLERRGPSRARASAEIRTPVPSLTTHAGATRRTRDAHSRRIPTSRKALNSDLRFTQVSNINSSDEPCGKLKATRLREFVLRQDGVFPRRTCGGGTLPAHGFASDVPEYTHTSATLNDTELRKNLRRKNTVRKSFLGHALALNDLPIEAATARPTQRFPAHGEGFLGPRQVAKHFIGLS